MGFTFRPAVRENVGLIIGLAGPTGSGKTYTAMRLAKGICGKDPFSVIDTEASRAKHYADQFHFDHGDLTPPFTPARYIEAIRAADKAGYRAILVDSTSHEWAGEGGLLDWHETELDRMAGQDYRKREASKLAAWVAPKMAHKKFVNALLQLHAHVILCFRAESKIEMVRGEGGKMEVVEKKGINALHGWFPVTEKSLPYELTVSLLLLADRPGVPLPIKLQEQHRALFPLDKAITESTGVALAAWAQGGAPRPAATWAIDKDGHQVEHPTTPPTGASTHAADVSTPASAEPEADYLTLIADAKTLGELKTLNQKIKKASTAWPAAAVDRLRVAYLARVRALSAGEVPA